MKSSGNRSAFLVLPTASHADIRRAYLSRLEIVRPERFDPKRQPEDWKKATEMVREINEAYKNPKVEVVPVSCGPPPRQYLRAKSLHVTWVVLVALAVVVVLAVSSRISRAEVRHGHDVVRGAAPVDQAGKRKSSDHPDWPPRLVIKLAGVVINAAS
jgi:hypothetical protein